MVSEIGMALNIFAALTILNERCLYLPDYCGVTDETDIVLVWIYSGTAEESILCF